MDEVAVGQQFVGERDLRLVADEVVQKKLIQRVEDFHVYIYFIKTTSLTKEGNHILARLQIVQKRKKIYLCD